MKLSDFLRHDWRENRTVTVSMRLTEKEKFVIDTLKGRSSYSNHYISLLRFLSGEDKEIIKDEKKHFANCFGDGNYEILFMKYTEKNQLHKKTNST